MWLLVPTTGAKRHGVVIRSSSSPLYLGVDTIVNSIGTDIVNNTAYHLEAEKLRSLSIHITTNNR